MEFRGQREDMKRFQMAAAIINTMTVEQARFALLLINENLRGYLMMPDVQRNFLKKLKRAIKAR